MADAATPGAFDAPDTRSTGTTAKICSGKPDVRADVYAFGSWGVNYLRFFAEPHRRDVADSVKLAAKLWRMQTRQLSTILTAPGDYVNSGQQCKLVAGRSRIVVLP